MQVYGLTVVFFYLIGFAFSVPPKIPQTFNNLDVVLNNGKLLQGYVDCLMERGPCTPQGVEIKSMMHEGLTSKCNGCTDQQKRVIGKIIDFIAKNRPDIYDEVAAKYDPEGIHKSLFQSS